MGPALVLLRLAPWAMTHNDGRARSSSLHSIPSEELGPKGGTRTVNKELVRALGDAH